MFNLKPLHTCGTCGETLQVFSLVYPDQTSAQGCADCAPAAVG